MKLKAALFLLPLLLILNSCYYTAQSYNHGKLLDPGDAIIGLGLGGSLFKSEPFWQYDWMTDDYYYYEYDAIQPESTYVPSKLRLMKSVALNFQLGVHDKYPFGGGIEVGLQFEGSYYDDYKYSNGKNADYIPALDFNVRLGFKDIVTPRSLFQHNVEMGWTTGMWLDNGIFMGYAAGWEFEKVIPYVGIRAILMPTNLLELDAYTTDENYFGTHDQKFNLRAAVGASLKIPKKKILPDYITPEFTLTGPNGQKRHKLNPNLHVAFRWTNGL